MLHDKTILLGAGYPASPAPADALQALADFDRLAPPSSRHDASSAFPEPQMGTWFDEGFDLREPEGSVFTGEVLNRLGAVENRNRKRRGVDQANHETLVRKLVANGLRCFHFHDPATVAIQRGAGRYRGKPQWLSGLGMAHATDLLAKVGLAELNIGRWGVAASTFELTPALVNLAFATGVTEHSLTYRLPADRLVRLREGNRDTDRIAFETTDETRSWTARLEAFNAFLAEQDVGIDLTEADAARLTARMNAEPPKGTMPFRKPELIKKGLYRQFNNGSFEEGGRLYGGWWITCPKDLRLCITINGNPTVELDYSGCMVRMLYHERGLNYRDDPYWLEPLDSCERENGLPDHHFREPVKRMMQALINGEGDRRNERIRMKEGQTFRPYFTRRAIEEMLRAKHTAIADAFHTGSGVRLQRSESDLALEIVSSLMAEGVPVLPIHDSFIIESDERHRLEKQTKTVYNDAFGFLPIVKG